MERTSTDPRDRSVADLLRELSRETSTLVRQELELAKAEMTEKGKRAGTGAGMLGGAGVAGLLALGSLTAAIIALIALAIPVWVSALIVAIAWGAVAGVLAMRGRDELQEATPPQPEQTMESVKEDVRWAKTRTS